MDQTKIQWVLQNGSKNQKLQLEDLISQVNLVVSFAIPAAKEFNKSKPQKQPFMIDAEANVESLADVGYTVRQIDKTVVAGESDSEGDSLSYQPQFAPQHMQTDVESVMESQVDRGSARRQIDKNVGAGVPTSADNVESLADAGFAVRQIDKSVSASESHSADAGVSYQPPWTQQLYIQSPVDRGSALRQIDKNAGVPSSADNVESLADVDFSVRQIDKAVSAGESHSSDAGVSYQPQWTQQLYIQSPVDRGSALRHIDKNAGVPSSADNVESLADVGFSVRQIDNVVSASESHSADAGVSYQPQWTQQLYIQSPVDRGMALRHIDKNAGVPSSADNVESLADVGFSVRQIDNVVSAGESHSADAGVSYQPQWTQQLYIQSPVDRGMALRHIDKNAGVPSSADNVESLADVGFALRQIDKTVSVSESHSADAGVSYQPQWTQQLYIQSPVDRGSALRQIDKNAGVPNSADNVESLADVGFSVRQIDNVVSAGESHSADAGVSYQPQWTQQLYIQSPVDRGSALRHIDKNAGVPSSADNVESLADVGFSVRQIDNVVSAGESHSADAGVSYQPQWTQQLYIQSPVDRGMALRHIDKNAGVPSSADNVESLADVGFALRQIDKTVSVSESHSADAGVSYQPQWTQQLYIQSPVDRGSALRQIDKNAGVPNSADNVESLADVGFSVRQIDNVVSAGESHSAEAGVSYLQFAPQQHMQTYVKSVMASPVDRGLALRKIDKNVCAGDSYVILPSSADDGVSNGESSLVNYLYYLVEQPGTHDNYCIDDVQYSNSDGPHMAEEVSTLLTQHFNTDTTVQNNVVASSKVPLDSGVDPVLNPIKNASENSVKSVENQLGAIDNDHDNEDIERPIDESDEVDLVDHKPLKDIQLTRILQSNNFVDQNNYVYTKTVTRSLANSYFRCKNKVLHGCKARAIAKDQVLENSVLSIPHNHKADIRDVDNEKFNKEMERVLEENEMEKPLVVYLTTKKKLINEINTQNIAPPKSKESFVYRRKIKKVPKLPKTIRDFMEIMKKAQYKHFSLDERKSTFYRGNWEVNNKSNLVFISKQALDTLNTLDNVTLLMDGTFKVLPRHFRRRFRQLYVISFLYKGRSYPLAYVLMQTKDFESYDHIFHRLKLLFPSVTISGCMSDYEQATRKALNKHFPNARISGCFFHYVQAIHKAFKRHGMLTDELFQSALQEVAALALLPNGDILPGFDCIDKQMKGLCSKRWTAFSAYWREYWPKANISVYGLTDRTNNFSESLNNIVNSLSGPRPDIWKLIANLKLIEMQKSDELRNNVANVMIETRKSQEMIRLNSKIKAATNIFNENRNVAEFLKNVTSQDKFESFFKARIFIDGVDSYVDDDGIDEPIIPNTFNEQLDFAKAALKRKMENLHDSPKKRKLLLVI